MIPHRIIGMTMGFTQSLRRRTGLEVLFGRLVEGLGSAHTQIHCPRRWDDDAAATAGFVARNLPADGVVDWIAYSYGGGVWFPKFEQALFDAHGRSVRRLYMIDPVPRFRPFAWLGGRLDRFKVHIRHAQGGDVYYQEMDYPRSPGVMWPQEHVSATLPVGHAELDNWAEVHDRIVQGLKK